MSFTRVDIHELVPTNTVLCSKGVCVLVKTKADSLISSGSRYAHREKDDYSSNKFGKRNSQLETQCVFLKLATWSVL